MIRTGWGTTTTSMSKPRASGDDPLGDGGGDLLAEVNPARAGMIPEMAEFDDDFECKPRASGDDPDDILLMIGEAM